MLTYYYKKSKQFKLRGKLKLKKILSIALTLSILGLNTLPVTAITEEQNSHTPRQFKSMVTKNKRTTDDYKFEYVNLNYWKSFNDDLLNEYIQKAILNNYDLKMATLATEEYYQQVKQQFASELPSAGIGYAPNYVKMPGNSSGEWTFAAPALVQYEFDIFLKNHDKTKAAKKNYESSKFDERAAYIAVAAAVGTTYLNIVELDRTIALQEEIVQDRQIIFDLMLLRNKEGLTSTADTIKANKSLVAGKTDLLELKKQRETLLHQLAVLIGESPENTANIARNSLDDINYNYTIPDSISTEIIMQRPDYLSAEKQVEKAGLDVGIARKEFLPTINLSGLALFNTTNFGSLFSTKGMLYALGGAALLPLFTGGSRVATLRLKKNTYERLLQNYYKTNLTAMQEINDSLVSVRLDKEKMSQTLKQANLERADYKYNEMRYEQGTISKLDLIQFRENLLTIDKLVAQQKVECMVDYIGLYKAAGSKI